MSGTTTTAAEAPAPQVHSRQSPATRIPRGRALLMIAAGLAMLAGLDAALLLLGIPAPVATDRLPQVHGMLLVLGFVGTVIALERAVALGRPPGFAAPALLGLGGLLLLAPAPLAAGKTTLLLGGAALLGVYVPLWRRQRDDAVLVQALGAVLATGALVLWLGGVAVPVLLPWLVGFIVLTIAGERLELARLALGSRGGPTLVLLSTGVLAATVAALLWPPAGYPLLGAALVALTGRLVVHDVARHTVRTAGVTRFMAASTLAGYAWLLVAGGTWLLHGDAVTGAAYDVVVHATFLGFTISMIMAHAPVILPAVLRRPLPWRPVLWASLALLHVSLVVRLWLGDALGMHLAWQVGGVLDIAALLLFFALAAGSVLLSAGRRTTRPRSAGRPA